MRKYTPATLRLLIAIVLFSALARAQAPEELNPPFCLFLFGHCTPGTTSGGLFYYSSGTYYYTPGIYFFTPGVYFFTPGTYYVYPDPLLKQDVDGVIQNLLHRRSGSRTDPVGSKVYQAHCPSGGGTTTPANLDGGPGGTGSSTGFPNFTEVAIFKFPLGDSFTGFPGPYGCETNNTIAGDVPGPKTAICPLTLNGAPVGLNLLLEGKDQTWNQMTIVLPGASTGPICTLNEMSAAGPGSGRTWSQTDPVLASDGELVIPPTTDLSLGGPLPLVLSRTYTALQVENSFVGMLGFNWMTNFDPYIITAFNYAAVIIEGGRVIFQRTNNGYQMVFPAALPFQLIGTSDGGYRFYDPRQNLIYTFNMAGLLIRIEDRNGNALTVTQGTAGPTQVSDGLGRTLSFTYSGIKVSQMTDQTGRSISYGRNGNLLAGVTDANSNSTTYAYGPSFGGITATRRPRGNVPYTQIFNQFTQVAQQIDSKGNKSAITYASGGTPGVNTLTDPLGRSTTFSYPNLLDAASVTDAAGQTASATYDSAHRVLTSTDRLGNTTSFTYDANSGDPASFTDAQGNTTSFTWQAQVQGGFTFYNLAKITYPDGTTKTLTYDASGNPLAVTDRAGKTTTYTYNRLGQVLTETNPAGGVTTRTYNADGTLATAKDPAGNVTTYSYDSLKRLDRIQFADGSSRSLTRDAMDKVLSITDERGNVTRFTYDANGNLESMTDALSQSATTSYDTDDLPSTVTDRLGGVSKFQYDPHGSVTAFTNAAGETTTFAYDSLERLQTATDPAGKATTFGYDAEGRPTSVTDALGNKASIQVDKDGRPVQFTSPLGESTMVAYDSLGRVTAVTDALDRQETFAYEPRGLMTNITAPGGISTSLAWGDLPVLKSFTDPNGNVWKTGYDSQGRLLGITDPLGQSLNYSYNSRSLVSSLSSSVDSLQISYDAAGNATQAKYSDGSSVTYAYDGDNRLTGGTGFSFTLDAEGRLTGSNGLKIARSPVGRIGSITYAAGKTVTYTFDSRGLPAKISDWAGGSVSFSFDAAQRLTAVSRSNGVVTQYTYDLDGRVVSITETSGGKALASINLTRDAIGRATAANRTLPQEAVPGAPGVLSLAFDAANQVSGFNYDALGRLIKGDAGAVYQWNPASRLVSYRRADGSASFTYDGLGQRISRTGADGVATNYVLNYATALPSVGIEQSGGADVRYYVYTAGGTLLYSIEASSGAHHFYSFDEAGNTTFLTADDGAISDAYGISPYGDVVTAGASNKTVNPFTWQGEWGVMQEPGTSLFYLRFRYYDAAFGRFLSRDPLFSPAPAEVNSYQYAAGDPLAKGDPAGLKKFIQSVFWSPGYDTILDTADEVSLGMSNTARNPFGTGFHIALDTIVPDEGVPQDVISIRGRGFDPSIKNDVTKFGSGIATIPGGLANPGQGGLFDSEFTKAERRELNRRYFEPASSEPLELVRSLTELLGTLGALEGGRR